MLSVEWVVHRRLSNSFFQDSRHGAPCTRHGLHFLHIFKRNHIFILQCRVEQIFTFVFMLKVPSSNLPENPQGAQTPNTTQFGWHRLHTDTTHTHTPTTLFRHQQHNRVWEESSFIITKKTSSILIELDTQEHCREFSNSLDAGMAEITLSIEKSNKFQLK